MPDAPPPNRHTIAAWIAAAGLLFLTLHLRLLPALLAGLLVYELVHVIALRFTGRTGGKIAAVGLLATVIVGALVAAMFGIAALLQGDADTLPRLLQKMAEILETSRDKLPSWVVDNLPGDPDAMKGAMVAWLREHATELRTLGGEVGHVVVHILIGMVIGAMVSLREATQAPAGGPLVVALAERARRLGDAFRNVVFAQVRISALNTAFTAIYLLVALPLAGVHLPYAKTLVAVTFIVGLLPVVGNLISNTVIVIVSLSQSLGLAITSLVFLVVIHKLEYFLNARIVGARIRAKAWEILIAMLVMESAFGIAGLVAAPIYYAYLKDELAARKLI
ncbi:MAG: AI-2E family transporter [Burkholderiales bacterium]|nr:AI-2E family transporter [Burkholderiales bacterium]